MFTLTPKQKEVQHKRAWGTPPICTTWCPSRQTGCCSQQNSRTACAGPIHITGENDIGVRPCCPGAGQKFTAANGLVNFCSVNNGAEFNDTHRYLGPNHYTRYTRVLVPKEHPPDNVITTYGGGIPKPGQIRENYGCCSSSDEFGIF